MKGTLMNNTSLPRFAALVALAMIALTGCAAEEVPAESATAGTTVMIEDAWVKAADDGMSAAFGVLHNSGDSDATVISVSSEAADMVELHETVENESGEMVMRKVAGGFTIPAGGELPLDPGMNHIMLMGLKSPLVAGEEVVFTLTFSDRSTYEFTAPVKDYSGANENYDGDDDMDH